MCYNYYFYSCKGYHKRNLLPCHPSHEHAWGNMQQHKLEATGVTKEVLCLILDFTKPLWKGELADCGVVFSTNSLEGLGFKITHSVGSVVESDTTDVKGETVSPKESSDNSITNTKDSGKSDKSSTNTQNGLSLVTRTAVSQ